MSKKKAEAPTLSTVMATAEECVARLEQGDLPLEDALKVYEDGVGSLRTAYTLINQAEEKIKNLLTPTDGAPILTDFIPEKNPE